MVYWRCFLILMLTTCMAFTFQENPENHALYISVVKIEHKTGAATAKIHMRVFTDDLKSVLRNKFGYEAIREKETFCTDYENYINRYFEKQFICSINDGQTSFKLADCERTDEVYQLTFEMDCPETWTTAQINAGFFMELFPKQSNVLNVEDGTTKRFGRATKGNKILKIRF